MKAHDPVRQAARLLRGRRDAVALTGAGISVESGIPAFRGTQGLWGKYDPAEYATIGAFLRDPAKVWKMLSEIASLCGEASPNQAHAGLAELEGMGIVRSVITQNVDGLHQAAGSRQVIEYHGNMESLVCIACWKQYPTRERWVDFAAPACDCGQVLKPNVVLFGEPIPWLAQERAEEEARTCGVLLVVGTSAEVSPACDIPRIAKRAGAAIVEINPERTRLTSTVTDIHVSGSASAVLGRIVGFLRNKAPSPEDR